MPPVISYIKITGSRTQERDNTMFLRTSCSMIRMSNRGLQTASVFECFN